MWDFVRREALRELDIDEAQLDRGGYNIVTTFDKDRMKAAEKAIKSLPPNQPEGMQAGLVSIDPDNGGIEAFYGGKNYLDQAFNASTQSHVQSGSTFKPFALVAGLENGVRLTRFVPRFEPDDSEQRRDPVDGQQLRQYELRPGQPAQGDPVLDQHRLCRAQRPGRTGQDRRCGAAGRPERQLHR
jgi:membrane peptidoglycan carboxypeptidase